MMGCLLGCFNASKHQRRPKSAQISPSRPQSQARAFSPAGSTEKTDTEALIEIKSVSNEKQLEQLSHGKKKVAFDLNVKIHEVLPAVEEEEEEEVGLGDVWIEGKETRERESESVCRSTSAESNGSSYASNNRYTNCASSDDELGEIAAQEESSESLFSLSIDSRKHFFAAEVGEKEEVNSPFPVKSSSRNELHGSAFNQSARLWSEHLDAVLNPVENLPPRKAVTARANSPVKNQSKFSTNCASGDDELGGTDLEEIDVEEDRVKDDGVGVCGGEIAAQEESSESLFSLSIDSRRHFFVAEVGEKEEVNSPFPEKSSSRNELNRSAFSQSARLRSEHVDAVSNPVENLPQRKAVTARANSPVKNQDKENVHKEQDVLLSTGPKPTFTPANHLCKPSSNHSRFTGQEIAVVTSLSSWLVDSEAAPKSKRSNDSVRNPPSERASTPRNPPSPRWSRGRPPDKPPVLGTVGSYWSRTGQAVE